MKKKLLHYLIAVMLIITLAGFDLILMGHRIILAINEETSITFEAYFEKEQAIISQTENLSVNVLINDSGILENGKIKLENNNFVVDQEKIADERIKSVNQEGNEIELNQIIGEAKAIILPIKFNKNNANTANYFEQVSNMKLIGEYRQEGNTIKVEKQFPIKIMWTEQAEINLNQETEKYINLGEAGILIQQKIQLEVVNNVLPVESEELKVEINELDGQMPYKYAILQNGKKIEENRYQIDEENKIITINYQQNGENIQWKNEIDEYKIIYTYPKDIGYKKRTINLNTNANIKLYTKDTTEKSEAKQQEIDSIGHVITLNKITTPYIYKGYLYANVENKTQYNEKLTLEVSSVDTKQKLSLKESNLFLDEQNKKYDTKANIAYQKILINKENMINILGENGNIQFLSKDGITVNTIDNNSQVDENGNIVYSIDNGIEDLEILITEAEQEGNLEIYIQKAINGKTEYTKQQLKRFVNLETTTQLTSELETEINSKNIELKDTKTEAKLEINNKEWSTLQENTNIQMVVTLKSNNNEYDLWKNPKLYFKLPDGIENIKVNSIIPFSNDIFVCKSALLNEEEKVIQIELEGEQLEFNNSENDEMQMIINCDVTMSKLEASKDTEIELKYKNDNGNQEEYITEVPIHINSKYGVLLYSSLDGYNNENNVLETISNDIATGKMDIQAEEKQSKAHTELINNFEDKINNIEMIVNIPNEENTNLEMMKSTVNLELINAIQISQNNVEVYYATEDIDKNSDKWTKELLNLKEVKKVKIVANELNPGEKLPISYLLKIPENISENQVAYQVTMLHYQYQGQEFETYSNLKLMTEQTEKIQTLATKNQGQEIVNQNLDGVNVNVKASTVEKEINNGDSVKEGQTIKYNIEVKNNTQANLHNFSLEGFQTDAQGNQNVTFFNMKKLQELDLATSQEVESTRYMEDPDLKSIKIEKSEISVGETVNFQYEFTINERKNTEEITKGKIVIRADDLERTIDLMQNKIEESELKLITTSSKNEEWEFRPNIEYPITYTLKNLTDKDLENINLTMILPKEAKFDKSCLFEEDEAEFVEYADNAVKFKINKLNANSERAIVFSIMVDSMDIDKEKQDYEFSFDATVNGITYSSNQLIKTAKQHALKLNVVQTADNSNKILKTGDTVTFTTTIKNMSSGKETFYIEDFLQEILQLQSAYIEKDGQKIKDIEEIQEGILSTKYELSAYETIQVVIQVKVGEDEFAYEVQHYIDVHNMYQDEQSNIITYGLDNKKETENPPIDPNEPINPDNPDDPSNPSNPSHPDDPNNPNNPDNPDNPSNPNNPNNPNSSENGNISGIAWLDSNKDGIKNEQTGISGISVALVNSETEEMVATTKTNQNGEYNFSSIKSGSYLIAFKYDTSTYAVTKYRVQDTTEDKNSDVISKELQLEGSKGIFAITDKIKIQNNKIDNIDAGFYQTELFDLSLQKTIKTITVKSSSGTKIYNFNESNFAKIEIPGKELAGANVTIEYAIKVKNEGETEGIVSDIVDIVPKDLTFDSKTNKGWQISKDGKLHTQSLASQKIKPGETKTITLILTKTMSEDNTGSVYNTAEIAQCSNSLGIADIDSTAGNNKSGEDDISLAEVLISVKTGGFTILVITITILAGLAVLGFGIYEIKKILAKGGK